MVYHDFRFYGAPEYTYVFEDHKTIYSRLPQQPQDDKLNPSPFRRRYYVEGGLSAVWIEILCIWAPVLALISYSMLNHIAAQFQKITYRRNYAPVNYAGASQADAGLTVEPSVARVPAAGGTSTHTLTNSEAGKIVFKVKSSNNSKYRVNIVHGIIDGGDTVELVVTRFFGLPKDDRLVIQFAPAPEGATDAQEAFKGARARRSVMVPIFAE